MIGRGWSSVGLGDVQVTACHGLGSRVCRLHCNGHRSRHLPEQIVRSQPIALPREFGGGEQAECRISEAADTSKLSIFDREVV